MGQPVPLWIRFGAPMGRNDSAATASPPSSGEDIWIPVGRRIPRSTLQLCRHSTRNTRNTHNTNNKHNTHHAQNTHNVYKYTHTHTNTHTRTRTHKRTHMRTHTYAYTHTHTTQRTYAEQRQPQISPSLQLSQWDLMLN